MIYCWAGEVEVCLGGREILKVSTGEVSRGEGEVLKISLITNKQDFDQFKLEDLHF